MLATLGYIVPEYPTQTKLLEVYRVLYINVELYGVQGSHR